MTPTANIRLDALLKEKELLFGEKLQLIRTIKQTMSFLTVVLGLVLGTGGQAVPHEVYLVIPFLLQALGYYLYANLNMLNFVCQYIAVVEQGIRVEVGEDCPQYQLDFGSIMGHWGINMTKREGYVTPNAYHLLAVVLVTPAAAVYGFSAYNAWLALRPLGRAISAGYQTIIAIGLVVLLLSGARYAQLRIRLREDIVPLTNVRSSDDSIEEP